ncbi:DNA-binding anti-repressor SinI [Gracilibacillus kekensis]|uniref:Anti-repressor SinI n=1 Tax=Gracilibacillus kekensis TaxID=1027249 RepID=A0A1M7NVQ2_9BACI|nr:DNA-binding anti-repressor SinI [Gracilibacillus kekensis]SHN08197.1 Anti-repressor SinI [Gracilibacillus kekensis]
MKEKLNVDYDWIYLMAKAKEEGFTIEEIRTFLDKNRLKEYVK